MEKETIEFVNLTSITTDVELQSIYRPLNEKELYDLEKLMVKADKLYHPLIVSANILVDGHHRLMIAKKLGWKKISVTRISPFPGKAKLMEIARNLQRGRRNLTKEEIDKVILKTTKEVKDEIGERRGGFGHVNPPKASGEANGELPVKIGVSENPSLIRFKTEIGKKTSEIVAEIVEEKTGVPVSKSTVERVIAKTKPKKDFVPKPTVKICIIFRRMSQRHWETYPLLFATKSAAQQFVKEEKMDGNSYFERELKYLIIDVDFYNEFDQKALLGAE